MTFPLPAKASSAERFVVAVCASFHLATPSDAYLLKSVVVPARYAPSRNVDIFPDIWDDQRPHVLWKKTLTFLTRHRAGKTMQSICAMAPLPVQLCSSQEQYDTQASAELPDEKITNISRSCTVRLESNPAHGIIVSSCPTADTDLELLD